MKQLTSVLVAFLLVIAVLARVTPVAVMGSGSQTGTDWTGTLKSAGYSSITLESPPCIAGCQAAAEFLSSDTFSLTVSPSGAVTGRGMGSREQVENYTGCTPDSVSVYYDDIIAVGGHLTPSGSAHLVINESFVSSAPSKYVVECPSSVNTYLPVPVNFPNGTTSIVGTVPLTSPYSSTENNETTTSIKGSNPGTATAVEASTITLRPQSFTSVTCLPSPQLVGRVVSCEAEVSGVAPTGTVNFGAISGSLIARESSCQLSPDPYSSTLAACQIPLTSASQGTYSVTAHYSGDSNNPPSDGSTPVTFAEPESEAGVSLSCDPTVVNQTLHASCTAKVSGALPQPIGTIAWNSTNPTGIPSASTCILVEGSCGVTYFQGNASQGATITAAYSGDPSHLPQEAADTISVLAVGVGTLDQRQTMGFLVRVSGTPGETVNASSTYLLTQPNGTTTAPFASNEYFDLRVSGGATGSVDICHYGANVNASTSLDYYYGQEWRPASNVVATAGVSVCGDIPASALSGTPLDIGGNSASATTSTTGAQTTVSSSTSFPAPTGGSWTSIGPFGVPNGFASPERAIGVFPSAQNILDSTVSGSVRAIGASNDHKTIYTGGSVDLGVTGIWRSTDGGDTWTFAGLGSLVVTSILVDPSNPSTVLANGINFNACPNYPTCPGAIEKSIDGGGSWSPTYQGGGYDLYLASNSTVYATTQDRVLKSNNFGSSWVTTEEVQGQIGVAAFADNGATVFVGGDFGPAGGSQPPSLLRLSGGKTTTLYTGLYFNSVVVDPSNSSDIWASYGNFATPGGVLQSTDGGSTWTNATTGGYVQYMALDPVAPGTLLLGSDGVLVTFGGSEGGQALLAGPDVRYITSVNGEIMVGSDQGLFVSADGGKSWQALNARPDFLVSSVAAGSSALVFSAQDYNNAFRSSYGGKTWSTLDGACLPDMTVCTQTKETGWVVADPYNSSVLVMVASAYALYGYNMMLISDDGGSTFQPSTAFYNITSFPRPRVSRVNDTVLSPPNLSVLPSFLAFASDGSSAYMIACPVGVGYGSCPSSNLPNQNTYLFKTQDGGKTWTEVAPAPGAFAVGVGGQNPEYIYLMNVTSLYVSKDGGSTFKAVGYLNPGSGDASIAIDPTNPSNVAVAALDQYFAFSTDGGKTFNQVSVANSAGSSLVDQHPRLYTYLLPSGRVALFLLTDSSIQVSFDWGRTWAPMAQGLPPMPLESFSLSSSGNGYISTWGYGIWEWQNMAGALESAPLTGSIVTGQSSGSGSLLANVLGLAYFVVLVALVVGVPVYLVRRRRRKRASGREGGKLANMR